MRKSEQYEQVGTKLLRNIQADLHLDRIEPKQKIRGNSGTYWEVDALGCRNDGSIFIFEFRRYPKTRQCQEQIGALGYRIKDCGATGGAIISPRGLQHGAQIIAQYENIADISLDMDCSEFDYFLKYLNKRLIGASFNSEFRIAATVEAVVVDRNGNIVNR